MGVDANDFIAAAFEGNFIDAVVDVAEVQVEGFGEALDLVGDLEEFRVLVLGNAVLAIGRDGDQFLQRLGGGFAVFHPGVKAQQTVDFVLLFSGQRLVVLEGADGRAEVGSFGQVALGDLSQELPEILDRCSGEGFDDG
jgi:hypothetical protein